MLGPAGGESGVRDAFVRKKMSKHLKGKEEEWTAVAQKRGPLRLLDLPVDVLKEIVKEVTHTNDLTALALTHSALHNLAIPHIYSRFDIVWPDANSTSDTRTGVDALTYGLATLVMGRDVFGQGTSQLSHRSGLQSTQMRLGNNYPQFTRKFSLGNGPPDWVQEYMITKESGKMLGTLVALAVARMVNLETFIWDMPTGVLRDVWLALASLQLKSPPGQCRLERLLVRWHDNSLDSSQPVPASYTSSNLTPHNPAGGTLTSIGIVVPSASVTPSQSQQTATPLEHQASHNRVESPSLSVLPPLKSLSVLDIDELAYLDEMSVLIEKSKDRLQELRVGISKRAVKRDFVLAWDGPGLQQVDHNLKWPGAPNSIGDKRLGGVLGILLGRVFDLRKKSKLAMRSRPVELRPALEPATPVANSQNATGYIDAQVEDINGALTHPATEDSVQSPQLSTETEDAIANLPQELTIVPLISSDPESQLLMDSPSLIADVSATITSPGTEFSQPQPTPSPPSVFTKSRAADGTLPPAMPKESPSSERQLLDGKLKLQILELERVPLSIAVLQKAFDWSMITSLTILDCVYHENLWRMLRRQFQPQICPKSALATSSFVRHSISTNSASKILPVVPMDYQLNIKKIHTDFATPALIAFLKETLAPNSLEVLFLQDRRRTSPSLVSINDIYRGPLRRHRRSLRKLLIDSSDKIPKGPNNPSDNVRWKTWMLTHEVVAYITSGNMTSLRELSVAIEYKDWHFFLRRLPQVPSLRSLNIPFIADHVTPAYDPRELAMQVVDMIFLRPEVELCYLGISNKCFEILENRSPDDGSSSVGVPTSADPGDQDSDEDEDDGASGASDEEAEDNDDEDEDEDDDEANGTATEAVEADNAEYWTSDPGDSEAESSAGSEDGRTKFSLRLREILFYDDKVAIFKARHMRL